MNIVLAISIIIVLLCVLLIRMSVVSYFRTGKPLLSDKVHNIVIILAFVALLVFIIEFLFTPININL